ncbi:hypothetical protein B0T13DRAFT_473580 [Neurospora crassa]|nr:hypothetical protein B0T13DRAFT_473580 [Neurospora crassa]
MYVCMYVCSSVLWFWFWFCIAVGCFECSFLGSVSRSINHCRGCACLSGRCRASRIPILTRSGTEPWFVDPW